MIGEICIREVVVAQESESVRKAAQLMREYSVRTIVITQERRPVGILTDRDIALRVVAASKDPETTTLKEVMSPKPYTIKEDASVGDGIRLMRSKGIRHLPVVDQQGQLTGIVTIDDLIDLLAEEMSALAALIKYEQEKEKKK